MPRQYKPDPRGNRYKKYDEELLKRAVLEYKHTKKNKNVSLKTVADKYGINKSVLHRHCNRTMKKQGGQTVFSPEIEEYMIRYINICAEWGYPMDTIDFRYFIKNYLDRTERTVHIFKNNLPGKDFVAHFLKRHSDKLCKRNSQNIKRNRAGVTPESMKEYFRELESSISGVDPAHILNYDETNLCDDPGRKKILTKRGTKYPERVMNHSKASVSIMVSCTAAGDLLPPYVVYKAQNIYQQWRENGPPGTRYNRSQSGWFDTNLFEDWIQSIVLPYFRGREGKKVLIGDNLSSHLSLEAIEKCVAENISFVFLPPNSTHITQPLDVAFFRPMKTAWRNILLEWKKKDGRNETSVPKATFPKLLDKLMTTLKVNSESNILAGFRKTGIHPLDQNQVLCRLPSEDREEEVEQSVLDLLKELRYGTTNTKLCTKKTKLNVIPGRSVGNMGEDNDESRIYEEPDNNSKNEDNTNQLNDAKDKNKVTSKVTSKKGKGVGKKTKKHNDTLTGMVNIELKKKNTKEDIHIENETMTEEKQDIEEIFYENDVILDYEQFDINTMPLIFEEDLVLDRLEANFEDTLEVINNDIEEKDITEEKCDTEDKKHKVNIISIEKFTNKTKKIQLKDCKKLSKSSNIVLKPKHNNDEPQPSTSGVKFKPKFYTNDDDILRALMDS